MSNKWRVYNNHRNGLTHREKFRDDQIEIKAGEYILMDYEDAVQFKGNYFPMKMTPTGVQDPVSFKEISIVPDTEGFKPQHEINKKFVCQRDGKEFQTEYELKVYSDAKYGHEVFKDEALDKETAKSPELPLESEDSPVKKKMGRPFKSATV